jgi:hypothetical protein
MNGVRMKSEMKHRLSEGEKVSSVLMWKGAGLSIDAKIGVYKGIVAPMLLFMVPKYVRLLLPKGININEVYKNHVWSNRYG